MTDSNLETLLICLYLFVSIILILAAIIIPFFLTKRSKFDFTITIGDKEKHDIRVFSDRMFGRNRIYVDGVEKFQNISVINRDLNIPLVVGEKEVHNLVFQIKTPFLHGSYKTRTCEIYDDGKLIKTMYSGKQNT